jgi:hypothetical protein
MHEEMELGGDIKTAKGGGDFVIGTGMEDSDDEAAGVDPELTPMPTNLESSRKFLDMLAKVIVYWFLFSIVACIAMWITGFVENKDVLWGIIILNAVTSGVGAFAIYQYGVIQDMIDEFKRQNDIYSGELTDLAENRDKLKGEVAELNDDVDEMQRSAADLEKQVEAFGPLLEQLGIIAKDSEELAGIIDETNQIFSDTKRAMLQNERASLLNTYYQVCYLDRSDGMSAREYERFLGMLSEKHRAMFTKRGTFEDLAGEDGIMDANEFQVVLEHVLKDVEETLTIELGGSADPSL